MEVYTKEQLDPWIKLVEQLQQEVAALKAQQPTEWIDGEEAEKLTGRSYGWFYLQRRKGTLPIAMLPRTEGDRRIRYSKADCIDYGRKHLILPPATLSDAA